MNRYLETIWRIIREKNIIPKLVCIILAVGFWAYISSIETGSLKFKVPVTYVNLDPGFSVSKISSKNILVDIRGSREELKNVSIRNLKLYIDLANAEPGVSKTYRVQEQKGDIPEGFKIEYEPEKIAVTVEKKIYKNVRIIPKYSGNVQKGFIVGRLRPSPEYVRIGGPADVVDKITAVYTENISVDERKVTVKEYVKIESLNEYELEFGVQKVAVIIPVLANTGIQQIDVPLIIKNRKKGFRYTLSSESVKLNVVSSGSGAPDEKSFSAYIDALEIDFSDADFSGKESISKTADIQVKGIDADDENGIIQVTPLSVNVLITKE
ncbi:MAG TPA: CdaR family protein [Spirochaetota bacterium]|nr:CdaR family protein [Spirochaetota bacterium]